MHWVLPIRREQFRAVAGQVGDDMRSIVLHFEPGTTNVDGFACSSCDWFYEFTSSEADGTLPRREVDHAHEQYAAHNCADFPRVLTALDEP